MVFVHRRFPCFPFVFWSFFSTFLLCENDRLCAHAWGAVGHGVIAELAYPRLNACARSHVDALLLLPTSSGDDRPSVFPRTEKQTESETPNAAKPEKFDAKTKTTLFDLANWADDVKYTKEYAYTRPWHYVDARDDEPAACALHYPADCDGKKGCIVSAVSHQEQRFRDTVEEEEPVRFHLSSQSAIFSVETLLVKAPFAEPLLFLLHLVGDLHQPLHASGRQKGGNAARVVYTRRPIPNESSSTNGKKKTNVHTNLHHLWDDLLIETRVDADFASNVSAFVAYMKETYVAQHGSVPRALPENAKNAKTANKTERRDDVVRWAQQSNAANCVYVWPAYDAAAVEGNDVKIRQLRRQRENTTTTTTGTKVLDASYYRETIDFVEYCLDAAAKRLAATLNAACGVSDETAARFVTAA